MRAPKRVLRTGRNAHPAPPLHHRSAPAGLTDCPPADRVTGSLLGYGVFAGPLYVTTSLVQVARHDGFDPTRHSWSLLAAGPHGWIQSANLVLTGIMVLAFAVGLARSAPSRWAPRLVGVFGLGMVGSGLMAADPVDGYPAGVPAPDAPTWHGIGHLVSGSLGFWSSGRWSSAPCCSAGCTPGRADAAMPGGRGSPGSSSWSRSFPWRAVRGTPSWSSASPLA